MAVAGSLTYDTKIDKDGFEKGLNNLKNTTNTVGGQIKSIITALGIDKLISATFNVINNSLDGAISRLDTLNNYPKVMSNLGIASEDAEKSINKMSEKLAGLPTTLDEGALAVQRFTSANGNIDKSTNYFLALNSAILAGGASAEIQSSALEQLSQAYAKGKPDMMEWRSLMTAMPAQLKQVATAMGYISTDELGEDLRNGKVSMDEFMDTIVKLNEEGLEGFQSFEEQARNSTGGIATSITVAKTQVVKGVADIISALDKGLKDAGLGGISEIISNIGKKAKEVLDYLADKLPGLLSRLPKIIEKLKEITPLIVGLTSAFIAFKTTIMIQTAINNTKKALSGLFAVISANPIALIIAIIAGLVASFIYLWNNCEAFRNFWIKLWDNIKKTVSNVVNAIVGFFTKTIPNAVKKLANDISQIGEKILGFFTDIWNGIKEVWQIVANWFNENVIQPIMNYFSPLINWFTALFTSIWNFIASVFAVIGGLAQGCVELIKIAWGRITDWFNTTIVQPVSQFFTELWKTIQNKAENAWNKIQEVWDIVADWFSDTIISPINDFFEGMWNKLKDGATKAWAGIKNVFSNVTSWFRTQFTNAWTAVKNVFSTGGKIFTGITEGITTTFKTVVNAIIRGINQVVKVPFDGINNALSKIRNVKILDYKPFSGLPSISVPQIPQLAKGIGLAKKGHTYLLEGSGDEAVVPLAQNKEWISAVAKDMKRAIMLENGVINSNASVKSNNATTNVINAKFDIDGSVEIDGQKLGRIITPYTMKTVRAGGGY